jgi:uracil phosphoribosyltransferase
MDAQYQNLKWNLNSINTDYNENVHIIYNPMALSILKHLSSPNCVQPQINQDIKYLYEVMLMESLNLVLNQKVSETPTRMPNQTWTGPSFDTQTPITSVSVARAGIIPSQVCFDRLSQIFNPENIKQDHVFMNRRHDADGKMQGIDFSGSKLSDKLTDQFVIIPDPMGATGSSIECLINYYRETFPNHSAHFIVLNLIITPEFVQKLSNMKNEKLSLFTLRLDRANSTSDALTKKPGEDQSNESGLNEMSYILPGAGGMGELINNALS